MILTCLIGYMVLLIIAARVLSRRMQSLVDFYLAGRSLPLAAITMAFVASWFGAASSVGSVNEAFKHGLSAMWIMAVPSFMSVLFIGLVVAKRIRALESVSMPQVFEARYGQLGSTLLASIILFCCTTLIASQLVAAGQLLHTAANLSPELSTWIILVAIIIYSIMGGFRAVVMTDVLQFFFFSAAIITLFVWTGTHAHWQVHPAASQANTFWDMSHNLTINVASTFTFLLAWSIAPEMWQRLSAVKKPEEARTAALVSVVMLMGLFALVLSTGLMATTLLPPETAYTEKNILISLTQLMTSPWAAAFVLIGFLSAISSTIDSSLNIACLSLSRDLIYRIFWPKATETQLVLLSRVAMLIVGWPAVSIALYFKDIMPVLWISADMYASTMVVPTMAIFFIPQRITKWSGCLAMSMGAIPVLIGFLGQIHVITLLSWYPLSPFTTLAGILMSATGFALGQFMPDIIADVELLESETEAMVSGPLTSDAALD